LPSGSKLKIFKATLTDNKLIEKSLCFFELCNNHLDLDITSSLIQTTNPRLLGRFVVIRLNLFFARIQI